MSSRRIIARTTPALALVLLGACATSEPYQPKKRTFDPGEYTARPAAASGSLYAAGRPGFIEDDKPALVGDVIVVRIDESDSASHDGSTKLGRKSEQNLGLSGALEQLAPGVNLPQLFGADSSSTHEGTGSIRRRNQVTAVLPVRVQRVLPNGDLYVEGSKLVTIGGERRELYVSGIVRPADVLGDGSVPSTRVADAQIEYNGQGDVSDQERRGWLTKLISFVWPF